MEYSVIILDKEVSVEDAEKYISEYSKGSDEGVVTFNGLLLFLNITRSEYDKLKGSGKRIFEMYKLDLEIQMEKMLRYQDKLPRDKYGKSQIDLKYIEWLLKKSNPSVYGDVTRELKIKQKLEIPYQADVKNDSGFSLTEIKKESNA